MKQEEIKFKGFKTYYSTKFIITAILMSTLGGLLLVMLPQCTELEQRNDKKNNAIQVESKVYHTSFNDNKFKYIEVVEIEGYKIIMWHNSYGSDMELVPLKPKEDE